MALTANKVLVSDNNGDIATSSTDSSKLAYIGSLTSNAEQTGNKVTSLSSANTDTQYPSAKAVYDEIVPNVSASYTAVSNKGGTLPATQNLANLATAIGSIPSGYSELPSYQVSGGVATRRAGALTGNEFSGILTIEQKAFYQAFRDSPLLTGNVNLSSVKTIKSLGLSICFYGDSGITGVDLSSLESVEDDSLASAFNGCSISSISLNSLETVSNLGLRQLASGLKTIENIYFYSLTTTSFTGTNGLTNCLVNTGTDVTHTLHFPSNLSTTIAGLTGYPTFGGTSGYVTLAFDLPATS